MIALLLVAAATCTPPASPELVGFWESRETSMGGIGSTLELRPDGSMVQAVTVIVDFRYELEGDRLRLHGKSDPAGAAPTTSQVRVEPDALVVVAEGQEVRKERVGASPPGGASIIGTYRFFSPALKRTSYERYGADGRLQLRMPIASLSGCYTIRGDQVVFALASRPKTKHDFAVDGDELKIHSEGKREADAWGQVAGGGWYAIDVGVEGLPAPESAAATGASAAAGAEPGTCSVPRSRALVGLWQGQPPRVEPPAASAKPSAPPAMTLSYLFRDDGSFLQAMTSDSRGTYRLEGTRLERKPAKPETGFPAPVATIAFEADRLIETPAEGPALRLHRLEAAAEGAPAIVGRWMSDDGQRSPTIYEAFDAQGNWERRILINRFGGCYEVQKSAVQLTLHDGHRAPPLGFSLREQGRKLRLELPGEKNLLPELTLQSEEVWYLAAGTEPAAKPLRPPDLSTLPGPEASDLLARVKGRLLIGRLRSLEVVELPSLARATLPVNSYFWGGERFSAPDASGRFVFFYPRRQGRKEKYESNLGGTLEGEVTSYTLVSMGLDGNGARELFSFESPELYAVGLDLEQSRLGRRVAYLRDVDNVKMTTEDGFCAVGVTKLRLFDAFWLERTLEREAVDSLNCGDDRGRKLAWHPDEKRLAYVALVDRASVEAGRERLGEFGRELFAPRRDRVPVVHLLDVESNRDVALGPGANLLFSEDGKQLVVGDTGNRWRTIDLQTLESRPLDLPGNWRGPVALLANGLVLYLALPTAGVSSPTGTLKVLDPATGRYQTVLRDADARMRFGAPPPGSTPP